MQLSGLYTLDVRDAKFLTYLTEDDTENPGNSKNNASPIGKAYDNVGVSQEKIAAKVGVHPSTISRYKHSQKDRAKGLGRRPSFDTLKKLSSVIGSKATNLFPELS